MVANVVTITKILDSPLNTILRINIEGNESAELTNYVIYNPALYVNKGTSKRLMYVKYCLFDAVVASLYWGATGPNYHSLINLEKDHYSYADFRKEGGLNNNLILNRDGKIVISTLGLLNGYRGYLIISIKHNDPMPGVA